MKSKSIFALAAVAPACVLASPLLVDEAHQTCPYSKATRGNIDVARNLV